MASTYFRRSPWSKMPKKMKIMLTMFSPQVKALIYKVIDDVGKTEHQSDDPQDLVVLHFWRQGCPLHTISLPSSTRRAGSTTMVCSASGRMA